MIIAIIIITLVTLAYIHIEIFYISSVAGTHDCLRLFGFVEWPETTHPRNNNNICIKSERWEWS